ncbi:trehalase-like domain-containing protein [Pilimelia columellifera]|uniref:Trehalase-like N-terminal domain-containing protein n=1 Tax=Pilimelia columellifera subsp. columellifera TaxID=706583 RepID=A0ABP6AX32_9ACTN
MGYQPIEDYEVIGDLHTVGLVSTGGSLDYLCLPDFDSPTVFAALLDDEGGGRFRIAPVEPGARLRQLYLPDTNVLLTRFLSATASASSVGASRSTSCWRWPRPARPARRPATGGRTGHTRTPCGSDETGPGAPTQAFTHLGLIGAARRLDAALSARASAGQVSHDAQVGVRADA